MIKFMVHLIDKDALVAEIKRIKHETNYESFTDEVLGKRCTCRSLLSFIDIFEVKEIEVDLEKKIKKVQYQYKTIGDYDGYPATLYANDIETIAKQFFKLGLKAQKGK